VTRLRETATRLWPWLAAIVTGLLGSACFPPFEQTWLVWIAWTPLLAAIWFSGNNSPRRWLRNFALGYVAGIVFFTVSFGWLGALGTLFESFWLHGLPFLLALYMGLYFATWSFLLGMIRPASFTTSWRNLLAAVLAASGWVALEWIRGWLFGGFGWNGLGAALHAQWPLIQIAEFTGVAGLSFVIALANVIAVTTPVRLFLEARAHRMRPHWDVNLTMLAIIGLLVFGWHVARPSASNKSLRVAAVQAGIAQKEISDPQFIARNVDRYRRWTEMALQATPLPELVVWPEGVVPGRTFDDETASPLTIALEASVKTDVLLGADQIEEDRSYNAAVLVSNGGEFQVYKKIHLVPFGEYIPLRHSFPLFAAVAGRLVPGDFNRGEDYTLFQLSHRSDLRIAPLICFEDTIGELVRQFVLRGADVLVNVTNDGWFLHSAGSKQHLANAVFRCVETRRPMVRAANTGVTCLVNEFGRVTQILRDDTGSTFIEGVLTGVVDIPQDRQVTFYAQHGELFAKICAGVAAIALVVGMLRRRSL
jgi:apolipoprotein N-acyltransferase